MISFVTNYFFFSFLLCSSIFYGQGTPLDDNIPIGNYTIDDYDINDGLRQMQVNDIFVSNRGEIWIGTRAGVCIFDGASFDCFEDLITKPDYVYDIAEMADGRIAILSPRHLFFFDGNSFEREELPLDLSLSFPSQLKTDLQNRVWISKVYSNINSVYNEGNFFTPDALYPQLKQYNTSTIWPSMSGDTIYFISDKKYCSSLHNEIIEKHYESETAISAIGDNWYPASNPLDGTSNYTTIREVNNDSSIKVVKIDFTNRMIDTILVLDHFFTKNDHTLFKSKNHLLSINDGKVSYVLKNVQFQYNQVLSMAYYNNARYIGTDKGLVICTPSLFQNYSEDRYKNVWTISEMADNEIYFSSYSGNLIRYSDEKEVKQYNNGLISNIDTIYITGANRRYYFGSAIDESGILYLAYNRGILSYDSHEVKPFYPQDDISSTAPTLFLHYDDKRELFFRGTCSGVDIIDKLGQQVRKIDTTLFKHRCILTINQTDKNSYWFGATGGIAHYDYTTDSVVNYLYTDNKCPLKSVICSYVDTQGNFWIGGKGGLARYDVQKDSFLLVEELYNYNVNSIIQGNDNQLFLATIRGLLMIDPQAYLSDGIMRSRLFTARYGMEGIELNQNGFFKDSKGHIWTTSATNVVSFDPQQLQYKQVKLNPKIYKINGQRISYKKDTVHIEQGENSIYVDYGLQDDKNNIDILYRCRLDNDNWSDWTNNLMNRYIDLSSGLHTIKVEAKNITDPNALCVTESVNFKIDIALHQEPYYSKLLGILILVGVIVLAFVLLRSKRIYNRYRSVSAALQLAQFDNEELRDLNTILSVQLEESKNNPTVPKDQIEIKGIDKVHLVDRNNLIYFSAEDNGSRIHVADSSFWSPLKFKEIQSKIGNDKFVQIFRSTIINITKVKWINHSTLMMQNDDELKIGRTYKSDIQRLLK